MDQPITETTTAPTNTNISSNSNITSYSSSSNPVVSSTTTSPATQSSSLSSTTSTTTTNYSPISSDMDALRRLLELKQLWNSQKKELLTKGGKKRPGSGVVESQDKPKRKRRKTNHDKSIEKIIDYVRQIIEEQGGSCHLETLVEYLRRQWHVLNPLNNQSQSIILDDDVTELSLQSTSSDASLTFGEETKESQTSGESQTTTTTTTLSSPISQQTVDPRDIKRQLKYLLQHYTVEVAGSFVCLFIPDPHKDGCWILNPEITANRLTKDPSAQSPLLSSPSSSSSSFSSAVAVSAFEILSTISQNPESGSVSRLSETKPEYNACLLDDVMTRCFETHGGVCTTDLVCDWVVKNWDRRSHPRTLALSDEQVKERVLVALDTHPKYMKDLQNPNKYYLTNRKKRRGPTGTNRKSNGNQSNAREAGMRRRKSTQLGEDDEAFMHTVTRSESGDVTKQKPTISTVSQSTTSSPLSGTTSVNNNDKSHSNQGTVSSSATSTLPSPSPTTLVNSSTMTATLTPTTTSASVGANSSVSTSAIAITTTTTTTATTPQPTTTTATSVRSNTSQATPVPIPSEGCKCRQCQRVWSKETMETWYHGPGPQDWWCATCGVQWAKEHACPVCGRVYDIQNAMPDFVPSEHSKQPTPRDGRPKERRRRRRHNSDDDVDSELDEYSFDKEDGLSDEQQLLNSDDEEDNDLQDDEVASEDDDSTDSEWIQCDQCGRWVMCKCDGIEDLSLYDDENPNHLPYACPICRGTLKQLPLIFTYASQRHSTSATTNTANNNRSNSNKLLLLAQEAEINEDGNTLSTGATSKSSLPPPPPPGLVRLKMKMRDDRSNKSAPLASTQTSSGSSTTRSMATTSAGRGRRRRGSSTLTPNTSSDFLNESPENAIMRLSKVSMLDKGANPECKLVQAEKELLRQYETRKAALTQQLTEKEERIGLVRLKLEKVNLTEKKFAEEITKVREYLSLTRSALWERNQREFERQLDKLKMEKKLLDEKIEQDLVAQFRSYVQKKQELLQSYVEHILTNQELTPDTS